jgi:hypothetical protein
VTAMSDWTPDRECPDCGVVLRPLTPPAELGPAAGLMPELFQCPLCVVTVDKLGTPTDCPKLFVWDGDELRLAPDLAHWALADE